MWESFKAGWDAFTNNNWVLTITGILGGLSAILVILNKTSIGRKALSLLNSGFDKVKTKVEESSTKVKEFETQIKTFTEQTAKECETFKKECENKVSAIYIEYETFKGQVFKVLEQIPNAKVQAQVQLLKQETTETEEEIKVLLGETYGEIQKTVNESAKNEIASLKNEIAQLKELLTKTEKVAEIAQNSEETENYTDGEETKDSKATEENL